MNGEKDKINLDNSKTEIKSFNKYFFMVLILMALAGGIYYIINTTDYFNNLSLQATQTTQTTQKTHDPAKMSGNVLINPSNEIPLLVENENSKTESIPLKQEETRQLTSDERSEDTEYSLAISDMRKIPSQTQIAQNTAQTANPNSSVKEHNTAQTVNTNSSTKAYDTNSSTKTYDTNNSTNNNFILTPPHYTDASTEFLIPSNKELEIKRNKKEISKLEMLQKAKQKQVKLAANEKKNLPGTATQINLSNETVLSTPQDPVITNAFIQEFTTILVTNYNLKQKKSKNFSFLNATKLSQKFGSTMIGLMHQKGRQGIFEYAYHPKMIQTLSQFMAPQFILEMDNVATAAGFTQTQKQNMFHYYAKRITNTATILESIITTKDLNKSINSYIEIEKKLTTKKKEFTNTFLDFEIAKQEQRKTKGLEVKLNQISHEANAIEKSLLSSRALITSTIRDNNPTISNNTELFELALWVDRRKNTKATIAAIQALHNFSLLLSQK